MSVLKIKDIVKQTLTVFPETRDNDNLLILKVWKWQDKDLLDSKFTFWDFAVKFQADFYSPMYSITRARRKLQELNPELRGEKWLKRHEHEETVKEELKNGY